MREGHHIGGRRRKRVSRACDHCRKKKDRCDGLRPTCSPCRDSGSVCSYDPTAKKRGFPEGYVRGLEKLWALSISNIEGLESKVLALLGIHDETSPISHQFQALWVDESVSNKLHESWKLSDLYGELEKLLSTTETGGNILACSAAKGDGDNYYGFSINCHRSPSSSPSRKTKRNYRSSAPWGYDNALTSRFTPEPEGVKPYHRYPLYQTDTCRLRLPPNSSQLLDIYFSHTHTWFPAIAKHAVLRTSFLYRHQEVRVSRTSAGSGDHAALLAILSYTTFQQQNPIGSGAQSLKGTEPSSNTRQLYAAARSLIPTEKEAFETGHVQALLLLTLVNVGLGDWAAAWLLVGEAVRLTIHLGFEQHPNQEHVNGEHQGNSVFMGCFLIDTIISVRLGNCPHIMIEDLYKIGPLDEDGLEEWSPWTDIFSVHDQCISPEPIRSRSCFNSMVKLAGFMNRICRIESLDSATPSLCQNLLKDLENWGNGHPHLCRLDETDNNITVPHNAPPLLPHQTYLSLTYAATLSFLYLRFSSHLPTLSHPLKKMLLHVGPVMASHGKHFAQLAIPPLFEVVLRTIVNGIHFSGLTAVHGEQSLHSSHVLESIYREASNSATYPVLSILAQEMDRQLPSELPCSPHSQFSQFNTMSGVGHVERPMNIDDRLCPDAAFARYQSQSLNPHPTPQSSLDSDCVTECPRSNIIDAAPAHMGSEMKMRNIQLFPREDSDINKLSVNTGYDLGNTPSRPRKESYDNDHSSTIQAGPSTPRNSPSAPSLSTLNSAPGTDNNNNCVHPFTNDMDVIFHDLAHLDPNQWTAMLGREKILNGFGFAVGDGNAGAGAGTDTGEIKAFCCDPERPASAPKPPIFHSSSIADIWPPGVFPGSFRTGG